MKTVYKPLAGVDLIVAQTLRLGTDSGTFLLVEYVYGFERFGAYETWRGGWRGRGARRRRASASARR